MVIALFPLSAIAHDVPPLSRYAAILSASDEPLTEKDAQDFQNFTYLLADPMAGNFALDQIDLSAEPESVEKAASDLKARATNAQISFYYVRGSLAASSAPHSADSLKDLPGHVRVFVFDNTLSGPDDSKAALSVTVVPSPPDAGLVSFDFSSQAGGDNSVPSLLFEALRGNADKDHNRKLTIDELASFLAGKTAPPPEYDLGSLASATVLTYRPPSEVVKEYGPDRSMELASLYNSQQRWIETLLILRELRDSKVTSPSYRDLSETAQLNLALETRYSPDYRSENTSRPVDAGLDLLSDILLLANVHYVEDVDNRALFSGGIRNLQLLLNNKRTRSLLISPDGMKAADEFARFLAETLSHIYQNDTLSENDFVSRIRRIVMESDATVKLPEGAIVTEFVYGIPASLDPNTDFIPQQAYKEFQDDTKGHFGGIGVEITLEDTLLTVVTPLDSTPAAEAGLLPGDRIIAIEGESTDGIDLVEAVNKLRGPVGTKVTISVIHRGDTLPFDASITRGNIVIESVKGYSLDNETGLWRYFVDDSDKIAYLRMTDFKETTAEDLERVVDSLLKAGMRGLILDLRFNHGGLFDSAVQVSDCFLTSGVIVTKQGAHTKPDTYRARYFRTFKDFPLLLLVNDQSASASEIVAGALRDNKRATIVGSRTFGKGTVQTVFGLERGASALKLTTDKYYTPDGTSIHRDPYSAAGGLPPDVEIPMTDQESAQLVEVWHLRGLKADARRRLLEKEKLLASKDPEYKAVDPDAFADHQFEKALELIREKLHPSAPPGLAESSFPSS